MGLLVFEPQNYNMDLMERASQLFEALAGVLTSPEPSEEVVNRYLEKLLEIYKRGVGELAWTPPVVFLYHPEREEMHLCIYLDYPVSTRDRSSLIDSILSNIDYIQKLEVHTPSDIDIQILQEIATWADIPAHDLNSLIIPEEVDELEEWF